MPFDQQQSSKTNSAIYFVTGAVAILLSYSIYSHLKIASNRSDQSIKRTIGRSERKLDDALQLKTLAYLMQSDNANIRHSSTKIILDRAISARYLGQIIAACTNSQPIAVKIKALLTLQLLTKKESNRATLIRAGALDVLVDALKCTDPELKDTVKRSVAVAICDLIQGSDDNKSHIIELGVLEPIKATLTSSDIRNNELKYWTLMILYQLSLIDPVPKSLRMNGFVGLLACMARTTYGNTNMPKFCMQGLVRITANIDDLYEARAVLHELLQYDIVDLISNCLRQGDDVELIYWAAGLMHEFVLKEVAVDQFRAIKGIHAILTGLLSAEEMYISRVILRIIKFMAFDQQEFKGKMVESGMIKKIMHCLSLEDDDVKYWATLCIHVAAGETKSHEQIVTAPEFKLLLESSFSRKLEVALFVSDILSLICCISSNNPFMTPKIDQIIAALNTFLNNEDVDVQYNAAGAIYNVMAMTYPFANKVRDVCFSTLIDRSISASDERVQLTCTKGALMLAIKNHFLIPQVNQQVTEPLIKKLTDISAAILPVMVIQSFRHSSKKLSTLTVDDKKEDISDYSSDEHMDIMNAQVYCGLFKSNDNHRNDPHDCEQWEKYCMSTTTKQQLTGALSSLNILLENNHILRDVLTREQQHAVKCSVLGVSENCMPNVDDINSSIHEQQNCVPLDTEEDNSYFEKTQKKPSLFQEDALSLTPSPSSVSAATAITSVTSLSKLTEAKRRFIDKLVFLSLYPVLDEWTSIKHQQYLFDSTIKNEYEVTGIYREMIEWIKSYLVLPTGPSVQDHIPFSTTQCDEKQLLAQHRKTKFSLQRRAVRRTSVSKKASSSKITTKDQHNGEQVAEEEDHGICFNIYADVKSDRSSGFDSESNNSIIIEEETLLHSLSSRHDPQVEQQLPSADRSVGLQSAAETKGRAELAEVNDLFPMSFIGSSSETTSDYIAHKRCQYLVFTNRALCLLNSVLPNDTIRKYLIYSANFIYILVYLLEHCLKTSSMNTYISRQYVSMADCTLACLAKLFTHEQQLLSSNGNGGDVIIPKQLLRRLGVLVWQDILTQTAAYAFLDASGLKKEKKQIIPRLFHSRNILACCRQFALYNDYNYDSQMKSSKGKPYVKIDEIMRSNYCLVDLETNLNVRNDTWTFETVRGTHCVPALQHPIRIQRHRQHHRYAYEIVLESDGLMQIGWATDHFQFDPEGGKGVGDDIHSYGYDGLRCKKWHRRTYEHDQHYADSEAKDKHTSSLTCTYGLRWSVGDVITCAIDMDRGELRYFKNGVDMGVAFRSMAITTRDWYPAVSLATGQQCRFQFGDKVNPMKYLPEGYVPISALAKCTEKYSQKMDASDLVDDEEPVNLQASVLIDDGEFIAVNNEDFYYTTEEEAKAKNNKGLKSFVRNNTEVKEQKAKAPKICNFRNMQNHDCPNISLYFEVTVGTLNIEEVPRFGFYDITSNENIFFEYSRNRRIFIMKQTDATSPITYLELSITDGDTVGVAYIAHMKRIGLILNGEFGAFVDLEEHKICNSPSFSQPLVKLSQENFYVNYGERPFVWKAANCQACRQHSLSYLVDQL